MKLSVSRIWVYSLCATLALVTALWALSSALAQGPQGEGGADISAAATVASSINYQGELSEGGVPVTGNRTMTVRLYTNSACSTLVSTIPLGSVPVNNGRFSVAVPVPNGTFNGQGVWFRLDVAGTLMTCQQVLPAPYALGLRPGAYVRGATSGAALGSAIVNVENTAASYLGTTNGIYVHTATGSAVRASSGGMGVYATSDWTYAVRGSSNNGTGGYFTSAGGHGIWATTTSNKIYSYRGSFSAVGGYGIYATSQNNNAIRAVGGSAAGTWQPGGTVGVVGLSSDRTGVWGSSNNETGVYGVSVYSYGVDGQSTDGTAIRGLSETGNLLELYDTSPYDRRFYVSNGGYVYADGSYNCGLGACLNTGSGADVAERIDAAEMLEPGDVVAIDPAHPGEFRLSDGAFSTLVAGVVSTNPGITMNNNDLADNDTGVRTDTRPLLALVGQTPVKVSAENGAVRPGDLLVASATPGHAMRAGDDPPVGTVIGKALGSLEAGHGVISMLVMLR
jgi:hypothetical protein